MDKKNLQQPGLDLSPDEKAWLALVGQREPLEQKEPVLSQEKLEEINEDISRLFGLGKRNSPPTEEN